MNVTESLEIDLDIFDHWFSINTQGNLKREEYFFSTNIAGTAGYGKHGPWSLPHTAPKWIIDLNIKTPLVKLVEENKTENCFDIRIDRNFLEKKYKTHKKPELFKKL